MCQRAADQQSWGGGIMEDGLYEQAKAYLGHAVRTGDQDALDEAISLIRNVVRASVGDHSRHSASLVLLSFALQVRFQLSGQSADLDEAVEAEREAVAMTPASSPDRAIYVFGLSSALQTRFDRSGQSADEDEAIGALREAIAATPGAGPNRAMYLFSLSDMLRRRFQRSGQPADEDEAIDAGREAIRATSAADPERRSHLNDLGVALQTRFGQRGQLADLDEAIAVEREAVAAAPDGSHERTIYLSNLSAALQTRFERSGEDADLAEAIDLGREAVAATPAGDPNRAGYLQNFGFALQKRFDRSGQDDDLAKAIDVAREAVEATPTGHPDRADRLCHLGYRLRAKFERSRQEADLAGALEALHEAVAVTPTGVPASALYLDNLGLALQCRFERSGADADMAAAVEASRAAVAAAPVGDPNRALYLNNLCIALRMSFELTGHGPDLAGAVDAGPEAVAATPARDPGRPARLSNLGTALQTGYGSTGHSPDMAEAIELGREAVTATPAGDPSRAIYLNNLGASLLDRFGRSADEADLAEAIEAVREAVAAVPISDPNRAAYLANLGGALQTRYNRSGQEADLAEAIEASHKALAATPVDHPDRGDEKAFVYEDGVGPVPAGHVFYPESLRPISPFLRELNEESMRDLETYSANVMMELDYVIGYFRSLHDTHRAALAVYGLYRTEGRQYCLYLRSFSWAGMLAGDMAYRFALDGNFRALVKAALPPEVGSLSFINTLDQYPGLARGPGADHLAQGTIPSLRVLSHNWKEVVREVIRGARLVVLNAEGGSEGIAYEAELLSECGMAYRTIVTGERLRDKGLPSIRGFASVIDLGEGGLHGEQLDPDHLRRLGHLAPMWNRLSRPALEGVGAERLAGAIRALSTDDFRQTNQVRDLSELPCWVVDRNIAAAYRQFGADELAGVPYDHFIPGSLRSNWTILTEIYPQMVSQWQAIEATAGGGKLSGGQLPRVLDIAVKVFYVAVTLERYFEMAMSLSTIGMAHRMISGNLEFMTACYAHAARCAQWSGDSELAAFLTDAHSKLKREAGIATKGRQT
jgi:tetratricopeptide (TPR) repeat protein